MGSYDASTSGFFLVTSAQVLHLGDQHPRQCSNDDNASDEHLHIRYRESPGRRNGYSLHGAPPCNQAVFERDCDQREQFVLIALSLRCPVANLRHVSPDSCIMLLGYQRRTLKYPVNLAAILQHLPSAGKSCGDDKRIT
jgi:hypothetical protein